MKKILLLLAPALLLSTGAVAKVTYEDAVNSSKDYYQANASVHNPPQNTGLGPEENPDLSGGNEIGKWKLTGSVKYNYRDSGTWVPAKRNRFQIGGNSDSQAVIESQSCVVGSLGWTETANSGNSNGAGAYLRVYQYKCQ